MQLQVVQHKIIYLSCFQELFKKSLILYTVVKPLTLERGKNSGTI